MWLMQGAKGPTLARLNDSALQSELSGILPNRDTYHSPGWANALIEVGYSAVHMSIDELFWLHGTANQALSSAYSIRTSATLCGLEAVLAEL